MKDEDFVGGEDDDGGSPTDDSGEDDSDASDDGGEGEVEVYLFHINQTLFHQRNHMLDISHLIGTVLIRFQKSSKKEPKKETKSLPPKKKAVAATEEGSSKKRKVKRKKDPNAPKKAMSGFMYFSQMERDVSSSLSFCSTCNS